MTPLKHYQITSFQVWNGELECEFSKANFFIADELVALYTIQILKLWATQAQGVLSLGGHIQV